MKSFENLSYLTSLLHRFLINIQSNLLLFRAGDGLVAFGRCDDGRLSRRGWTEIFCEIDFNGEDVSFDGHFDVFHVSTPEVISVNCEFAETMDQRSVLGVMDYFGFRILRNSFFHVNRSER